MKIIVRSIISGLLLIYIISVICFMWYIHQTRRTLLSLSSRHGSTVEFTIRSFTEDEALQGTQYLQLVTVRSQEVLRFTSYSDFMGLIPLPDVELIATFPLEITFYVDIQKTWDIYEREGILHIQSPPLEFNTPAMSFSAIKMSFTKTSIFRREVPVYSHFKQQFDQELHRLAQKKRSLVLEEARKQLTYLLAKYYKRDTSELSVTFTGHHR